MYPGFALLPVGRSNANDFDFPEATDGTSFRSVQKEPEVRDDRRAGDCGKLRPEIGIDA